MAKMDKVVKMRILLEPVERAVDVAYEEGYEAGKQDALELALEHECLEAELETIESAGTIINIYTVQGESTH